VVSDQQLLSLLERETIANGPAIIQAFNQLGAEPAVGFTLAACLAVVENESSGENVWGHDPWNEGAYPKGEAHPPGPALDPVTQESYTRYKLLRDQGLQPQGCGPCQLTSTDLQVAAERAGGCWIPVHNCYIGFGYLRRLFVAHQAAAGGFAAYNGSGPAAAVYAGRAMAWTARWQALINDLEHA
jgi:hypothetical protein